MEPGSVPPAAAVFGRTSSRAAGLLLLGLLAACDLLPPRGLPAEGDTGSRTLDRMVEAARDTEAARRGLQPLARFIGNWEGSSESLRGTIRVSRRMSWLVEDSWLVEQTVARSADGGEEVSRGGALYRWDPEWNMIVATSFGTGGTASESWMQLSEDGHTFEIRARPDVSPHSLFQTTLYNGVEWRARVYDLDPAGTWNQAERLVLQKKE